MARTVLLRRGRTLVMGLVAITVVAGSLAAASKRPADAGEHTRKLLIHYATKSDCKIVPNYPAAGVVGNGTRTWTIPAGKTITWRYNVDGAWALVSDPTRAKQRQFPWWGFTHRDCIGDSIKQKNYPAGVPVPNRVLEGRSQKASGWRKVRFEVGGAHVITRHKKVISNGTLRDPANFVIGNVFAGWHVNVTNKTRSNGHWVLVYVPNAKRWGYIERTHLN
jgi:hypothetical protein